MATKSTSKFRQFSVPKRDWSVLTATDPKHVKRLEHIQETLDAAIEAIQEEGGIEDWDDFKNFVQSFNKRPDRINESGHPKASISVDLVTEGKGDEVSGFVFYLAKDPSHRTSSVYLVKNLKQAGVETKENNNYYTPSHVMDLIAFEASNELEDDELSEEFDDDLMDLEAEEELPKPTQRSSKLSKSAPSRQNSKQSPKQDEDDIDELLSDDEETPLPTGVLREIAQNRSSLKSINKAEPEQSEAKYPLLDSLEAFLKEAEHQGAIATTRGSEINGITVTGLTVQSATLMGLIGAKTVSDLIDCLEQTREKKKADKLEEILEQIDSLNQRTDNVSVRVQQADVIADMKAIENRTERLAERTQQIVEPSATTNAEKIEIEEHTNRNGSHHISTDKIIVAPTQTNAVKIGEKIDYLRQKIDPNYQKSPPLQIEKDANISEQLNEIQKYLANLSKRLDRLETMVDELEEKITVNPSLEQTHAKTAVSQIPTANPVAIESEPEDLLTKIVTQTKVQQQREAVANCLVNYAFASGQSPNLEFLSMTVAHYMLPLDHQKIQVAVIGSDGQDIFSGTKEGERWKFEVNQDKLTPGEREAIFKLPQTEAEYEKLATAQALVETFQSAFPKHLSS